MLTGLISTVVIVLYGLTSGENDELFWTIFAFSSCILLLPYLFMFPAFVKLRMADPKAVRPYKVPGGFKTQVALAAISFLFILQAVILFIFPDIATAQIKWSHTGPVLTGVMTTIAIGEWILVSASRRMNTKPA